MHLTNKSTPPTAQLYLQERLSDVTLEVVDSNGKTEAIFAHRLILALFSTVMEKQFMGDFAEGLDDVAKVQVPDIEAFKLVLKLAYTSRVTVPDSLLVPVDALLSFYDAHSSIKEDLSRLVAASISERPGTVIIKLNQATQCDAPSVAAACLQYIAENMGELWRSHRKSLVHLRFEHFMALLGESVKRGDDGIGGDEEVKVNESSRSHQVPLAIEEEELLAAIVYWCTKGKIDSMTAKTAKQVKAKSTPTRFQQAKRLAKHVRLGLMSPEFLATIMMNAFIVGSKRVQAAVTYLIAEPDSVRNELIQSMGGQSQCQPRSGSSAASKRSVGQVQIFMNNSWVPLTDNTQLTFNNRSPSWVIMLPCRRRVSNVSLTVYQGYNCALQVIAGDRIATAGEPHANAHRQQGIRRVLHAHRQQQILRVEFDDPAPLVSTLTLIATNNQGYQVTLTNLKINDADGVSARAAAHVDDDLLDMLDDFDDDEY